MDNVLDQWEDWLLHRKHKSALTAINYRNDANSFLTYLTTETGQEATEQAIAAVEVATLRRWLVYRLQHGYDSNSTRRAIAAIRSLYRFLEEWHGISNAAIHTLRLPKVKHTMPRPLTVEDALASIERITHIARLPWVGIRDRAILTLLYGTGMRIGEALALNDRDVLDGTKVKDTIRVRGKGGKWRQVSLLPVICKVIECYIALRPRPVIGGCPLFIGSHGDRLQAPVYCKTVAQVRNELGLEDTVTPHAFRHSFATHMLESGVDIVSVQKLLGHSNVKNTQIYTKVAPKHALEVYGECHPHMR